MIDPQDPTQPPAPAGTEPLYEVTVRVTVRRIADGRAVGRPAVASFDMVREVPAARIGEAAVDAAQLVANGLGGPAAVLTRARVIARDAARRPEVQRGAAILTALLRKGAAAVELGAAATAAKLVTSAPESE